MERVSALCAAFCCIGVISRFPGGGERGQVSEHKGHCSALHKVEFSGRC